MTLRQPLGLTQGEETSETKLQETFPPLRCVHGGGLYLHPSLRQETESEFSYVLRYLSYTPFLGDSCYQVVSAANHWGCVYGF